MAKFLEVGDKQFDDTVILTIEYVSDTPDNSEARSTDLSITLHVTGRILTKLDDEEKTDFLAEWAKIPAENQDCYKKVKAEIKNAGKTLRGYELPNAFVVDYREDFSSNEGIGTFDLLMRQKKDKIADVQIWKA